MFIFTCLKYLDIKDKRIKHILNNLHIKKNMTNFKQVII